MISFLFYIWAVIAVIYELSVLHDTQVVFDFKKATKDRKDKDLTPRQSLFYTCMFLYCIWTIVGLFTSQWLLFASVILLSLIPKKGLIAMKIDAIITIIFLVFIVINKYHLHYDLAPTLVNIVKSWI